MPTAVSSTIPLAFEWASWLSVGISWLFSAVVLVVIACVATALFIFAGEKLSASAAEAFRRVEELVQEQRGIGVPAIATLIAGVGAALSGVFLSKWVGCGVAIVAALATFAFESLAQNSKARLRLARWVFALGAVLPFGVIVAVSVVTGGFGDVDLEMAILALGGTAVGVLGVTAGLVTFWETKSAAETS